MIQWVDDEIVEVNGRRFRSIHRASALLLARSSADLLVLGKNAKLLDSYVRLAEEVSPRRILELGIHEGGSVGFLATLYDPDMLVAIDLRSEPVAALDEFIERHDLGARVKPYYGVDQQDRGRLTDLLQTEFGDEPLDLVIDDASHILDPTRASFDILFPRVRPGGHYVIEDWALPITPVAVREDDPERRLVTGLVARSEVGATGPLSTIAAELLLAMAASPGLIHDLVFDENLVIVTRGGAELDPDGFGLGEHFRQEDADLLLARPRRCAEEPSTSPSPTWT